MKTSAWPDVQFNHRNSLKTFHFCGVIINIDRAFPATPDFPTQSLQIRKRGKALLLTIHGYACTWAFGRYSNILLCLHLHEFQGVAQPRPKRAKDESGPIPPDHEPRSAICSPPQGEPCVLQVHFTFAASGTRPTTPLATKLSGICNYITMSWHGS